MLSVCGFLSGAFRIQDLFVLLPRDRLAGQRGPQHPVIPQSSQIVGLDGLVIRHCHIINLHSSDEIWYRNYSYVARTCKVRYRITLRSPWMVFIAGLFRSFTLFQDLD